MAGFRGFKLLGIDSNWFSSHTEKPMVNFCTSGSVKIPSLPSKKQLFPHLSPLPTPWVKALRRIHGDTTTSTRNVDGRRLCWELKPNGTRINQLSFQGGSLQVPSWMPGGTVPKIIPPKLGEKSTVADKNNKKKNSPTIGTIIIDSSIIVEIIGISKKKQSEGFTKGFT